MSWEVLQCRNLWSLGWSQFSLCRMEDVGWCIQSLWIPSERHKNLWSSWLSVCLDLSSSQIHQGQSSCRQTSSHIEQILISEKQELLLSRTMNNACIFSSFRNENSEGKSTNFVWQWYYYTLKKLNVAPSFKVPYWIFVCLARSSTEFIGVFILSTVRNAAKLAV